MPLVILRNTRLFSALFLTALSGFSIAWSKQSIVEEFTDPPLVECAEVPVIERGKFRECRLRYFQFELDQYLEDRRVARTERLEAERTRLWDWLDLLPKPNCEKVPEVERAKFFFHCNTVDVSSDLIGNLEGRLESLRADRDAMAERITELRETYAALSERSDLSASTVSLANIQALSDALAALDGTFEQIMLMEKLSQELVGRDDLPAILRLSVVELPVGAELWEQADRKGHLLGMVAAKGERGVKMETSDARDGTLIVHPKMGLGYMSGQVTDAEQDPKAND